MALQRGTHRPDDTSAVPLRTRPRHGAYLVCPAPSTGGYRGRRQMPTVEENLQHQFTRLL